MPRLLLLVMKVQRLRQAHQAQLLLNRVHLRLLMYTPAPMPSRPASPPTSMTAAVIRMRRELGILLLPLRLDSGLLKRAIHLVLPE